MEIIKLNQKKLGSIENSIPYGFSGIVEVYVGDEIFFSKVYFVNGIRHRIDGPAVEYSNGDKYWWLNGKIMKSAEEHFNSLTPEQQIKAIWNINEWR